MLAAIRGGGGGASDSSSGSADFADAAKRRVASAHPSAFECERLPMLSVPDEEFAATFAVDASPPAQSRKKHRSLRERLLVG
jgi:hypothetical protein